MERRDVLTTYVGRYDAFERAVEEEESETLETQAQVRDVMPRKGFPTTNAKTCGSIDRSIDPKTHANERLTDDRTTCVHVKRITRGSVQKDAPAFQVRGLAEQVPHGTWTAATSPGPGTRRWSERRGRRSATRLLRRDRTRASSETCGACEDAFVTDVSYLDVKTKVSTQRNPRRAVHVLPRSNPDACLWVGRDARVDAVCATSRGRGTRKGTCERRLGNARSSFVGPSMRASYVLSFLFDPSVFFLGWVPRHTNASSFVSPPSPRSLGHLPTPGCRVSPSTRALAVSHERHTCTPASLPTWWCASSRHALARAPRTSSNPCRRSLPSLPREKKLPPWDPFPAPGTSLLDRFFSLCFRTF